MIFLPTRACARTEAVAVSENDFPDHFSGASSAYSAHRPPWPERLFRTVAQLAPTTDHAVDCGCGSGQASVPLSRFFRRISAFDASENQIAVARRKPHPSHLRYRVGRAEQMELEDGCADLLLAAQSAHWYRPADFFAQARRVLRPGGLLAMCSYDLCRLPEPQCDRLCADFHNQTLKDWWPPQRALITDEYRTLRRQMPFDEIPAPAMEMVADWNLAQLSAYFSTWSATGRYRSETGRDPVPAIGQKMRPYWPQDGKGIVRVRWPVTLVLGRNAE